MKNGITLLLILAVSGLCAQQGQWIWMKGSSQPQPAPSWGIRGIASPSNTPGGLTMSCSWTDQQGRFWLFGGFDNSGTFPTIGLRDALWMFDPATVEWTWVKGTSQWDAPGVYGTMGVPDTANRPSARRLSYAWVDNNGDLWMFGGDGLDVTAAQNPNAAWGSLNDLWRYSIATNTWTWMGGSQYKSNAGSYGTLGVAAPSNLPSARYWGNSWVDTQGNFWLFGGRMSYTPLTNRTNELWKYDPVANLWTWIKGGPNHPFNGSPGTQGVPAPTNLPPARYCSAGWSDNAGNFWMYGGQVDTSNTPMSSYFEMEDLWTYTVATNEWTWLDGNILSDDSASFAPPCQPETGAYPGGRSEMNAAWEDACGNFWFYGGVAAANAGTTNNMWCYQPSANKWYFVSGDQYGGLGYHGIIGVANPLNVPEDRTNASAWVDNQGNFWVFGGATGVVYNDLWKFIPDYCCNPALAPCCSAISVGEISAQREPSPYPNPATTEMHIALPSDAGRVYLFDINGRIVFQDNNPSSAEGIYYLPVSGIAAGSYLLRIEGRTSCTDQQIVVQQH